MLLLPHPSPLVGDGKYMNGVTVVSISTDSVNVTVPGGCWSQGCYGYMPALLKAHILPGSTTH